MLSIRTRKLAVERGIIVSYELIRLWRIKIGPKFTKRYLPRHLDQMLDPA
jgi:transposase-like protein